MLSDIEIAQNCTMLPIGKVAEKAGLLEDELEYYGKYKAKISDDAWKRLKDEPDGKLILVTAINPTPAGEGKTTTTVGLGEALNKMGKNAIIALREPSLGPVFGIKGGAAGGGYAQVVPMEDINLHFTGDMHAIGAANNLLCAMIDNHMQQGNALEIDPRRIIFTRVVDMNDRALRNIIVGMGGSVNGVPREDHYMITVASEVMAILCLATSLSDLKKRCGDILVAYRYDGSPVFARDLKVDGAMCALLKDAIKPNLVQTLDGSPCLMHGGPFANVSIGIPTLVSVEMACALHDVVIVEAGYGTDAGAQKWLDIACREYDAQWPSAAIVVTRASTWRDDPDLAWRYPFHVQRLEGLDIPTFPLINLWDGEDDQIPALKATAKELEFRDPIIGNLYRDGGDALAPQLDAFVDAVTNGSMPAEPHSHKGMALVENVRWVAEHAYGVPADRVILKDGFAESLQAAEGLCASAGIDFGSLALVAVKSPATMTDNDRAPEAERTVTLKKVEVHSGAGLVHVNLTTSLTTPMPKIV